MGFNSAFKGLKNPMLQRRQCTRRSSISMQSTFSEHHFHEQAYLRVDRVV